MGSAHLRQSGRQASVPDGQNGAPVVGVSDLIMGRAGNPIALLKCTSADGLSSCTLDQIAELNRQIVESRKQHLSQLADVQDLDLGTSQLAEMLADERDGLHGRAAFRGDCGGERGAGQTQWSSAGEAGGKWLRGRRRGSGSVKTSWLSEPRSLPLPNSRQRNGRVARSFPLVEPSPLNF